MGDAAALPLTREQIEQWEVDYGGVRVGKDCLMGLMGPLFAQARAALDLADEVKRLRAENARLREAADAEHYGICGRRFTTPGRNWPWMCERPIGHNGPHAVPRYDVIAEPDRG